MMCQAETKSRLIPEGCYCSTATSAMMAFAEPSELKLCN